MLAENLNPASQTGEDQASGALAARAAYFNDALAGVAVARRAAAHDTVIAQAWSTKLPAIDNAPLAAVILGQARKPLAGDVIYVTEVRHHVLTDDDLNAAARVEIGGAA